MWDVVSGSRWTELRKERGDDMNVCANAVSSERSRHAKTKHERTLECLECRNVTRARVSGLDEIPSPTCPRRRSAQESTYGRDIQAQLLRAERGARRAPHKSLCDFCRRPHATGHAGRPALDMLRALAVLHAHAC